MIMIRRIGWCLWMMVCTTLCVCAQEDTVRIARDSLKLWQGKALENPSSISFDERIEMPLPNTSADTIIRFSLQKPSLIVPYYTNPSPMFKGDYSTAGILLHHRHGALMGAGNQTTLPGIGRSNSASLSYIHALGDRWTLQVGVDANKMLMSHFTGQSFGASGTLSYQAADRLSFHVFGGYNGGYVSGMQSYRYGGSVAWDMTERFGMEMGVQRYYNPMRGGWETVPIATPYYRFNNGAKVGFDVGGLLYQIFHSASFKSNPQRVNPTIGPPRPRIEIR